MLRIARSLRIPVQQVVRTYVTPMKELNFLLKDVLNINSHYAALGYDAQVRLRKIYLFRIQIFIFCGLIFPFFFFLFFFFFAYKTTTLDMQRGNSGYDFG